MNVISFVWMFAKEFNDDTPNEESDVENSEDPEDMSPGGTD
mgnify:CR=1 FL=1